MASKKRYGVKQFISMNLRAIKLISRYTGKRIFICDWLRTALDFARPFPNLYISALIIDELLGARDINALIKYALFAALINLGLSLAQYVAQRVASALDGRLWYSRERIDMDKMLDMDFQDAESTRVADLRAEIRHNSIQNDWGLYRVSNATTMLMGGVMRVAGAVGLCAPLFGVIAQDKLYVIFALLGVIAASVLLPPILASRANTLWANQTKLFTDDNRRGLFYRNLARDAQRGLDVRAYAQRFVIDEKAVDRVFVNKTPRNVIRRFGLLKALGAATTYLSIGCIYLYVGLKALSGAFGAGAVLKYVGALTQLAQGIGDIVAALGDMRDNLPFLETQFEFLDIPNNMYQGTLSVEKRGDKKYEFELRDVSFKYPGADTWALRHVSMKIHPGERLAVVGKNGSGKTTLIKLLCRLYDPTEGEILLNDFNIRKYDYKQYMDMFSVVFQDFALFSLPLAENIAVSKNCDENRARAALERVGFPDMPLNTPLGRDFDKNGVNLSGGEAQKAALARALYKDAPYVVLDEPTAALDPIAEAEVYSRFNGFIGACGAIFISHRLSSCRFCDDIAVFSDGKLVQRGAHDELLSREGEYAELWRAQAQYYA